MKRIIISILSFFYFLTIITAQSNNWNFTPSIKFEGLLKSKYEYAERTSNSRFSIRNSRFAISGDITPIVSYKAMVELSNSGQFSVLDLYGAITPVEGLMLKLGQYSLPIHNSYITNPGKMLFANRAFIGKYFTPSTRDIGLMASYDFNIIQLPLGIDVGIFNANKNNEPDWTKTPSYAARLRLGGMKGLRTTAKLYKYPKNDEIDYLFYGVDLRYESHNWKLETEFMQRENQVDNEKLKSAYLQGAYWFPINDVKLFKNIITAARWDAMGSNTTDDTIDINRLTLGLGFSFTNKPFGSLIRIDYEFYSEKNKLPFINKYDEMSSDKLSVELLLTF